MDAEIERLCQTDLAFLVAAIPSALSETLEGRTRISSIVRAMKEFSHLSNGLRESGDLREVINTTVTVARNEWKCVADVETALDPELSPVPCFRDELSQVLVNLIVNASHAIRASTEGGARGKGLIRITTHANPGFAEIRICDNACGSPNESHHRVLSRSSRLSLSVLGQGKALQGSPEVGRPLLLKGLEDMMQLVADHFAHEEALA